MLMVNANSTITWGRWDLDSSRFEAHDLEFSLLRVSTNVRERTEGYLIAIAQACCGVVPGLNPVHVVVTGDDAGLSLPAPIRGPAAIGTRTFQRCV